MVQKKMVSKIRGCIIEIKIKQPVAYYTTGSRRILLVFLACLPLLGRADVYQWQDADGRKNFSDRSHPQAKKIKVTTGYGFYPVKNVYDGDTIALIDDRKVRLLGINTPEVRHRDRRADIGGDAAKQWLKNRLAETKVRLVMDVEKIDKYGRTLAHLFTDKNEHINLELVRSGLAEVTIYPPNLLYANELVKAQDDAEQNHRGIWRLEGYKLMSTSSLVEGEQTGWTRLADKVTGIRVAKKYLYLEFSSPFEVKIERKWLSLFPDVKGYIGKTIEVRGWLSYSKGRASMLIRHPSAIKLTGH